MMTTTRKYHGNQKSLETTISSSSSFSAKEYLDLLTQQGRYVQELWS